MAASDAETSVWLPRRWSDEAAGLVWLPRVLSKGRRKLEGEQAGRDLLSPYLFGQHDLTDSGLLRFLRANNAQVLDILRRQPDDDAAAAELVAHSGRTPAECAAWNAGFLRFRPPVLAMLDADEGRRAPGWTSTLLRVSYAALNAPIAWAYHILEWRQRRIDRRAAASR